MEYFLAIWLIGQSVPQYVVGPNELGNKAHAITMSHADCERAVHEAKTLHKDHVADAKCIRPDSVDTVLKGVPLPRRKP